MSLDPISAAFEFGVTAIKGIWGDKDKQAEEIRKLQEVVTGGDVAAINAHVTTVMGQIGINALDAQHPHWFVSGWRPALGWLGACALFYNIIVYNLMVWSFKMLQVFDVIPYYKIVKLMENGELIEKIITITPPGAMEAGPLFAIVTAMLGVGVQRSYDKKHGTDTKRIT
jgi:hypothetical protein